MHGNSSLNLFQQIVEAPLSLGSSSPWVCTKADLHACPSFLNTAESQAIDNSLKASNFRALLPLFEAISAVPLQNAQHNLPEVRSEWQKLVEKIVAALPAKDNYTHSDWLNIFSVCLLSDSLILRVQSASIALKNAVSLVSFEDGLSLIKKLDHLPKTVLMPAISQLSEERALTPAQRAEIQSFFQGELSGFLQDYNSLAQLSAFDIALNFIVGTSFHSWRVGGREFSIQALPPEKFLSAMMRSEKDDSSLISLLYERWLILNRVSQNSHHREAFALEGVTPWVTKPNHAESRYVQPIPSTQEYKPFTEILLQLYSLGEPFKIILLRKVLLGDEGLLSTKHGRKKLTQLLLQQLPAIGSEDTIEASQRTLLQKALIAILESGDPEEIFARIAPFLAKILLQPPEKSDTDAACNAFAMKELLAIDEGFKRFAKKVNNFSRELTPAEKQEYRQYLPKLLLIFRKLKTLTHGVPHEPKLQIYEDNRNKHQAQTEQLLAITSPPKDKKSEIKNAWDMVLLLAQISGAETVRAVQWLPLYKKLDAKAIESLKASYDQNPGQSSFQFYHLLERVAKTNPAVAQFLSEIQLYGTKLGGGSLFSVFRADLPDGKKVAVGAQNSNAEYFLEQTHRLLLHSIEHLQSDPALSDEDGKLLSQIQLLLEDVRTSLIQELHDGNFQQKDGDFREGIATTKTATDPKRRLSGGGIFAPVTNSSDSELIRIEDFVDGINLSQVFIQEKETAVDGRRPISLAQFKEYTSLLTRSLLHQVFTLKLVHPDLSIGNIRIRASDGHLGLLDRRNLLKLSDVDVSFIKSLLNQIKTGNYSPQDFLNYLLELRENTHLKVNKNQFSQLSSQLPKSKSGQNAVVEHLFEHKLLLQNAGVHIPLSLVLLLKNVLFLNEMVQRAEFSSMTEALKFSMPTTEKMKYLFLGI